MPLGLPTGFFGVNAVGRPGMNDPQAFTLLCPGMRALAVLMIGTLKLLRWL